MGKMENAATTAAAAEVKGKLSLTPQADGLKWPEPPVFDNPYEERLHRKQRLAVGYRIFSMFLTWCWSITMAMWCKAATTSTAPPMPFIRGCIVPARMWWRQRMRIPRMA